MHKRKIIPLTCVAAFAALLAPMQSHADLLIASPQTLVSGGEPLRVVLVATGTEALPDETTARLLIAARSVAVTLRADGPAQGSRRAYTAALPPELEGLGTLELADQTSTRLLVQFRPAPRAAPQIDTLARMQGRDAESVGVVDLSKRETALSSHEPMYFVAGSRGNTTARFQLSFKYRLFDPDGWAADFPWVGLLTGLHFGYT